jgi:hypothetical protein
MKILISTLLTFTIALTANAQTVCYAYDAAGNRTTKVVGPCNSSIMAPPDEEGLAIAKPQSIELGPTAQVQGQHTITGRVIPNPTNSVFEVNLEEEAPQGAVYELYDALGRLLAKQAAAGITATFDISGESPGVCYLFLNSGNAVIGKWVVAKQ